MITGRKIFSETRRIITTHARHFLALSALFLLPISSATIVYPFLLHKHTSLLSHYLQSLFLISTPNLKASSLETSQLIMITICYILIVLLCSLCAYPSITYSTFNAFNGKPVKFISSLECVRSFFPLLATVFVKQVILGLIIFAFGVVMLVAYYGLTLLGFEMDYESGYSIILVMVIVVFLVGLVIYFEVEWCLSTVVVVLESKWGFASLKRSSYLVKGMRKVVLSVLVVYGVPGGILTTLYSNLVANVGGISQDIVFMMVIYSLFMTILSLYSIVSITVLFVYCKSLHGEIAMEVDEEIGGEYVRLGTDDRVTP